jgi:hypothetical protein
MSDDPEFSRRDFLKGLAAAAGTAGAPELPNEGFHLHKEAVRLAMEYLADEITGLPNDKIGTLAVLENTIDGYRLGKFKHHPLAGSVEVDPQDMATALEDAAKLIRSGWKPPQWWYDFTRQRALRFFDPGELDDLRSAPESGSASRAPLISHETKNTPPERAPAVPTITLAEHVDELRAELRGGLDSRERNMIATELDVAHAALEDRVIGSALRLEVMPNQLGAADAKMRRDDVDTAVARLSAETGLPHTPAAGGEFVTGIYRQSLTLSSGKYAMIDNGLGFALVPWSPELDRHLGRHVVGVAQESGGIEWSFGRKRGLEI